MKRVNKHRTAAILAFFSTLIFTGSLLLLNAYQLTSAVSTGTTVALINAERQAAGLSPLASNSQLNTSAYLKVQDMCTKHYWAHNSPDGTTPWTFVSAAGYSYTAVGENLAQGYSGDAALVAAWMASPGHRANILNGTYRDVGVATTTCNLVGSEVAVVVAHFGTSKTSAAPAPAPTAPKPVAKPTPAPAAATTPAAPAPVAPQPTAPVSVSAPAPQAVVLSAKPAEKKPSFLEQLLKHISGPFQTTTQSFLKR